MAEFLIRHAHIEDCPALAHIIIHATQDAFRGRVPDRCLEWLTPEESAANWAKNFVTDRSLEAGDYLFVAETDTGGVIGFAMLSTITAGDGYDPPIAGQFSHELRSLQVDPAWQRLGVGRRLVSRVADELRQAGTTRLLVRMLVDNPNQGFYEHLGAVRLGTRPFDWEGYQTEEILFGWYDLGGLINLDARA